MRLVFLCGFLIFSFYQNIEAQVDVSIKIPIEINYTSEKVIDNLDIPWGMDFLPDGSMLITEKKGQLLHVKNGVKTIIGNVPEVLARGQGGLLDVCVHPDYVKNGWIYLTYSAKTEVDKSSNTTLMRSKLKDGQLIDIEILYKASPNTNTSYHYGSRIVFDDNGFLYFGIGDRGEHFVNPQDISKDGGKIYRLKDDGSIPDDNPFVHQIGAKTAIYSYGHRNPQGMAKHPITGQIWENEHGPQGGDEINIIVKGKNYGWPIISYGINYDGTILTDKTEMDGMEQPLYYYVPSIAPSCMAFVYSDKYPDWSGNLLIGSLKFQYLERLVLNENRVTYREKIMADIGRVRNVKISPDGYIYIAVEGQGIYKIVPKK